MAPVDVRFRCGLGQGELSAEHRTLLLDGQPVRLGGRAFVVLVTLIERRDRLVTKQELMQAAWPGLVVEENNLAVQIATLRRLLGPQAIATIPGRGYRFVAPCDSQPPAVDTAAGAQPRQLARRTVAPVM